MISVQIYAAGLAPRALPLACSPFSPHKSKPNQEARRMSIRSLLCVSTALALAGGPARAFTLHVLHINDFHSRVESINKYNSTCSAEDEIGGKCFGGYARLYTAVNMLRDEALAAGDAVLVVAAGDQFQGSLFFSTYSGAAEAEFMNLIGFDAMVLGNHEFDLGPGVTADFIDAVEFPVIFGNTDASGDPRLAKLNPDPVAVEFDGVKVGILGAITRDTAEISSPGDAISFNDPVAYLSGAVADLEGQGVSRVIALTHVGVVQDFEVARNVVGLDLVVGGHSNTLFSNTAENTSYPYPEMVEGPGGQMTAVVSAGAYSKYLGHSILEYDDDGNLISATGDTVILDASITPDEGVLARIAELGGPIEELKGRKVAVVADDIDGSRETCRVMECTMGNLVADAILDRVKGQGVTIALQNSGGLRASIEGGEVTMGDVLTVLPFQNTLSTFNLSGAGVVAALENGFSEVEEGGGRFPQVAGLRVTWAMDVPPMEGRIKEVLVREEDAWVQIDPDKIYSLASNNFMRNGGDGYSVLKDEGQNAYDYGPGLEDVVAGYLAANPEYEPYTDGRIHQIK
jgi:5'-nucleotidase/UDP-sugar diphosphatase